MADPAPKKFIVVHLLGPHINYKFRYPEGFDKLITPKACLQV